MMKKVLQFTLFVTLVALMTTGCAKKKEMPEVQNIPQSYDEDGGAEVDSVPRDQIQEVVQQAEVEVRLQRIHFGFNQPTLTPQARAILADNAAYLKSRPELKMIVEGYCDERGSDEYNLALGERRAVEAKQYLISLGVSPDSLSTISYGEENPLVPGYDEETWAMNRRAELNILP